MANESEQLAVLFADICESARLYEDVGDAEAYDLNARCLTRLKEVVGRHDGTVIRTEGDGILCTFTSPDRGFRAAAEMQQVDYDRDVLLKIGLHFGPVIHGVGGDVYGASVNLASRLSTLAHAEETLVSGDTVELLSRENRERLQPFDRITFKGAEEPIVVYCLQRENQGSARTIIVGPQTTKFRNALLIGFRDREIRLGPRIRKFTIGRAEDCDLVVPGRMSSRHHAVIERKRKGHILTDQSVNGTYVTFQSEEPVFIRRESLHLVGQGVIALGGEPDEEDIDLVRFQQVRGDDE